MTTTIPYGSWPSPLTAAAVSAASPRLEGARFVGDEVWWGESVPERGRAHRGAPARAASGRGRATCCPRRGTRARACTSTAAARGRRPTTATSSSSRRTTSASGRCRAGDGPRPLTPADGGMRFGGLTWQGGRLLAIRETHSAAPCRRIATSSRSRSTARPRGMPSALLVARRRTATSSRSRRSPPDGSHLAWIAWDHPNMPWDTHGAARRPPRRRASSRSGRRSPAATAPRPSSRCGPARTTSLYSDDPDRSLEPVAAAPRPPTCDHEPDRARRRRHRRAAVGARVCAGSPCSDDGRIVAVRTNGDDEVVVIDPDGDVDAARRSTRRRTSSSRTSAARRCC